jgi:putative (di)nucleoside polyphosphate hydrolase
MVNKKYKKIIDAVMIFVLDQDKNVLFLKRVDNLEWEPVKGGVNPGENYESAALRELSEETGLLVVSIKFLGYTKDELKLKNGDILKIDGYIFFGRVKGVKPKPDLNLEISPEHNDYKWVSYADAIKEKIYPEVANKFIKKIIL